MTRHASREDLINVMKAAGATRRDVAEFLNVSEHTVDSWLKPNKAKSNPVPRWAVDLLRYKTVIGDSFLENHDRPLDMRGQQTRHRPPPAEPDTPAVQRISLPGVDITDDGRQHGIDLADGSFYALSRADAVDFLVTDARAPTGRGRVIINGVDRGEVELNMSDDLRTISVPYRVADPEDTPA